MRRVLGAIALGAVVAGLMATAAMAEPGQCTMTDFGSFDCDFALDGGGLTFGLPDGQVFAFALVEPGEGLGYLVAPGQRPRELGTFRAAADEAGCWESTRNEDRFCVLVAE